MIMHGIASRLRRVAGVFLSFVFCAVTVCPLYAAASSTPQISIVYPVSGACLIAGTSYLVTWNSSGDIAQYAVYITSTSTSAPATGVAPVAKGITGSSYQLPVSTVLATGLTLWVEGQNSSGARVALSAGRTINITSNGCDTAAVSNSTPTSSNTISGNSGLDTTAPAAPTQVTATLNSSNSAVTVSWTAATDNVGVVGYKINRNGLALMTTQATSVTDSSGISPGTVYAYTVVAYDSAGNASQPSAAAQVTVPTAAVQTVLPTATVQTSSTPVAVNVPLPAITGLTTQSVTSQSAQVLWNSSIAADSIVYAGTASNNYTRSFNSRCDGGGMVTGHCVVLSDLSPATTYYYKAFSRTAQGGAASSTEGVVVTLAVASAPAASGSSSTPGTLTVPKIPSVLVATPNTANLQVSLSWQRNSVDEKKFNIWRKTGDAGGWVVIGVVASPTVSFVDNVGTPGTYAYAVSACNDAGCSDNSVAAAATFPQTAPSSAVLPVLSPATSTEPSAATATGTLAGIIVDTSGKGLPGVGIRVFSSDQNNYFTGSSGADGTFSFDVPAGSYTADIMDSISGSVYSPVPVSVQAGIKTGVTIKPLAQNNYDTFIGSVLFSDGSAVQNAQIVAYNTVTRQSVEAAADAKGVFSLQLPAGSWKVGVRSTGTQGGTAELMTKFQDVTSTASGQQAAISFSVPAPVSRLVVAVTDASSTPVSAAGVMLSTSSSRQGSDSAQFVKTDISGTTVFSIAPGTYYVHVSVNSDAGYLNPDDVPVQVVSGKDQKISVILQKSAVSLAATGTVAIPGSGPVTGAQIWAWSEAGGSYRTVSDAQGNFSVPVLFTNGDVWHIGASKLIGDIPFSASEIKINQSSQLSGISLLLAPVPGKTVAPAAVVVKPATEPVTAKTADGAVVVVPQKAVSASGNIQLQVKPTAEAPSQTGARVVGLAYDITVTDSRGKNISQLSKDVEISLPYTDQDLQRFGLNSGAVRPSYFDDQAGTWVPVNNYTLDPFHHVVILRVAHFTRFALVAPADIVPPAAAEAVRFSLTGKQEVTVSWKDPKIDFHHSAVYRAQGLKSEKQQLSQLVTTGSYIDGGVQIGKTYYYFIQEVDAAGNQSDFTASAPVVVTGKTSTAAKTKPFKLLLKKGNRGSEVKRLQLALQTLGYYSADKTVNSKYDAATVAAVKAFQAANGIKQTGMLDKATRTALNSLL